MSPIRVLERVIEAQDGDGGVGIRTELFGSEVTVRWFCGDKRTFMPDELYTLIECLELLEPYPDVWIEGTDHARRTFYAQIRDGQLYADTSVGEGSRHVEWNDVKTALAKAVR